MIFKRKNLSAVISALYLPLSTLAIILTLNTSVADDEKKELKFRELMPFKGWMITERSQVTKADTIIFYKDNEIRIVLDSDQFTRTKTISTPTGCKHIHNLRIQGDKLLAVTWVEDSHYSLAWRSIKTAGAKWSVSPPFEANRSRPFCPAIDTKGRMVVGSQGGEDIFYQQKSGGPVQRFTFPLHGRGKHVNRTQTIVGPDGIIWLFEDLIGGATNYKGLDGALRFKDGAVTHHKLGVKAHIVTAVPVSKHTIFVGVYGKRGIFMDARTGTVKDKGPFDPSLLQDHVISRWSRGKDGAIWMVTFSRFSSKQNKEEKARNLFGQLWRWDGKQLKLFKDGYDRKKAFEKKANPVLGISADRVLAGCARGGLFYAYKGKSGWIDWRLQGSPVGLWQSFNAQSLGAE